MIHTGEYTQQVQIAADGQLMARKNSKTYGDSAFPRIPGNVS